MMITAKELIEQIELVRNYDGDIDVDGLPEAFLVIEKGSYTQEGKYQYCSDVIQHVETGMFFSISHDRAGSPFTDWSYSASEVTHVEKVTKTITVTDYVAVK